MNKTIHEICISDVDQQYKASFSTVINGWITNKSKAPSAYKISTKHYQRGVGLSSNNHSS